MPSADFSIIQGQPVRITVLEGIPVRSDLLLTDEKGREKSSFEKRNAKALQKLRPALQKLLQPGETVLYVARALSPLTAVEQITAAWWTRMLAGCVMVATNKRILFFPVKRDGSWRESVRAAGWGDLESVEKRGLLTNYIRFKFKNGSNITYSRLRAADAKKLTAIASTLVPAASGEQTAAHAMVQLCPDCCGVLTPGQYLCPSCGLIFKNERSMVLRSIFLPGGGYFYTGHPLIAIFPAIVEGLFLLDALVLLINLFATRNPSDLPGVVTGLLIVWALETSVTILHCRRYVRDFIPEKRDPMRSREVVETKNSAELAR